MPLDTLRLMMGAFCVLFAYAFGKSVINFWRGRQRRSRTIGWALRTILTGVAAAWRAGFDVITLAAFTLAAISFAGGAYLAWRPKREEEIDRVLFPHE